MPKVRMNAHERRRAENALDEAKKKAMYRDPDKGWVVRTSAIARRCDITRSAVYQWEVVPDRHVEAVHDVSGVQLSDLRPDLYDRDAPSEGAGGE